MRLINIAAAIALAACSAVVTEPSGPRELELSDLDGPSAPASAPASEQAPTLMPVRLSAEIVAEGEPGPSCESVAKCQDGCHAGDVATWHRSILIKCDVECADDQVICRLEAGLCSCESAGPVYPTVAAAVLRGRRGDAEADGGQTEPVPEPEPKPVVDVTIDGYLKPGTKRHKMQHRDEPLNGTSGGRCCKHCGPNSKPCGNSCISRSKTCHKFGGCAC